MQVQGRLVAVDLQGQFLTVVHSAVGELDLQGAFLSVVHSAVGELDLQGQWISLVHSAPIPTAIVPDITGTVLLPATFDGSGSISPTYYSWSWVSVPGGSSIAVGPVPFPDNGAATPDYGAIMVDNVALYHFEGVATDSSGQGNDLIPVNAPTYVPGHVGVQAADCDGVNQYFHVDLAGDAPTTDGTLACWFYLDSNALHTKIIALGTTDVAGAGLWRAVNIEPAGQLAFAGFAADITNIAPLATGQWYHVVLTWESTDNVVVYLDGVAVATATLGALNTPSSVLALGAQTAGATHYADYKVDEAAVWTRVLSAAEVATIYDLQKPAPLGTASTYTFTPDVVGTYTINLEVDPTSNTDADAVISAPPSGGGGQGLQGSTLQGIRMQSWRLQGEENQGE